MLSSLHCKEIRIPDPVKFLLVESGILGFGIRNSAQGIQNPATSWNLEFKFHWQQIWNPESTTSNPESTHFSLRVILNAIGFG